MKDKELNVLVERLAKVRLFAGMSCEEISTISQRIGGNVRRFAKDEIVVYEGTKSKWIVVVLSGRLGVYESASRGKPHSVRVIEAGGLFGSTLVTGGLEYYPGMAVATAPSEVFFLETAKIRMIWHEYKFGTFFANLYSIVSDEVLAC